MPRSTIAPAATRSAGARHQPAGPAVPARASLTPLLIVAITAAGAALRFAALDRRSFWIDEVMTALFARLPWRDLLGLVSGREANGALYYLILRAWTALGSDEFTLRALSAAASVASIPAIYALAARLFGPRAGLLAALLLAVNAFHIRFAQEVRQYSLLTLLVIASDLLFVQSATRGRRRDWAGYVAASVLALYTHFFAALAIAAQWIAAAALRPRALDRRRWLVSAAAIAVLGSPLLVFVLTRDVGQVDWIPPPRIPRGLYRVFEALAGNGGLLLALGYGIACARAISAGLRAGRQPDAPAGWRLGWPLAWLVVPIVLASATSFAKPVLVSKYLIVCLPAVVVLAAAGLNAWEPWRVRAGAIVVLIALAAGGTVPYYRDPGIQDWRAALRYLLATADDGDAVVFYPGLGRRAWEYYAASAGGAPAARSLVLVDVRAEPALRTRAANPCPDGVALSRSLAARERVWLVLSTLNVGRRLLQPDRCAAEGLLGPGLVVAGDSRFAGVRILLYVGPAP